jgi:hypothetical protein
MFWILVFHVKETNYFGEENTIAPRHVEQEAVLEGRVTDDQITKEHEKEMIVGGSPLKTGAGSDVAAASL